MGNLISDFSKLLKKEASHKPSGQHILDDEYYKRIEAVQFTISHDDGKVISDLEKSDVVCAEGFKNIACVCKTSLVLSKTLQLI